MTRHAANLTNWWSVFLVLSWTKFPSRQQCVRYFLTDEFEDTYETGTTSPNIALITLNKFLCQFRFLFSKEKIYIYWFHTQLLHFSSRGNQLFLQAWT